MPPKGAPGGAGALVDPIRLMDSWLDNIDKDQSKDSPAVKVARNKPPEASDTCWTDTGEKIVEPASYTSNGRCNQLYPPYADPRIASGGPITDDVLKCAPRPIDISDYKQTLTSDQVIRLKTIFPDGVCDYTRPGVEQRRPSGTWKAF
jgi:hypothetical protein